MGCLFSRKPKGFGLNIGNLRISMKMSEGRTASEERSVQFSAHLAPVLLGEAVAGEAREAVPNPLERKGQNSLV